MLRYGMTSCVHNFSLDLTLLEHIFIKGTILRRWKRNWFDLWADGRLVFYNDQQRRDMEDDIHMRVDCINIRNSAACQGTCHLLHLTVVCFDFVAVFERVSSLFFLLFLRLRAESTGGEDARRPAPDSLQRRTGHQPVCRQCG